MLYRCIHFDHKEYLMTIDQKTPFDPSSVTTPVYATQGGGYCEPRGNQFVWLADIPDFIFKQIGDPIPEEWSVAAVNTAAFDADQEWQDSGTGEESEELDEML
jgi:hypothetical protein